jgi:tetratricopeptide (TPR) repeat protein
MLPKILGLCFVLLIASSLAADVPFVFEQGSTGFAAYSSAQLEQAYTASSDLRGVPFASTPNNNEVLEFPVAGGSISPAGKTEKKAEDINKTLNSRVEPDNSRVYDLALALAAQHSGDYTIDQVCEIYSYLKYGNSTKKPWSYARDPRGVDYFNFASKSLSAGDDAECAGAGDCDDFAILMSSLVESIGGTTRIVLARNNSTGGHAYAEVYIGRLSDQSGQVEETIKWLQQEYDTEKIFTHIETDEKDVWLNLDWGNDAKGNAHPGGPFFQGDRHYVLCIRDKYGKTAVKPPEKTNKPPKLVGLTADKSGPQEAGAVITWTAEARDADKDPVLYRFFLNDDPVTKWTEENRWVWTTTEDDLGESQIEVQVRDGKHAGPDKCDANMRVGFAVNVPLSATGLSANQSDLAKDWYNKCRTLDDRGNYDDAERACHEAFGLDPELAITDVHLLKYRYPENN